MPSLRFETGCLFAAILCLGLAPPAPADGATRGPAALDTLTAEIGVLDSGGDVGRYCDVALDSLGNLHVVYLRFDNGTLKSLTRVGGVTQPPEILDASGTVGGYCAIVVGQDSVPKVSYRRTDTGALWYAGPEPARQWTVGTIVATGDAGRYCEIRLDSTGEKHVAYLQNDDATLKLVSTVADVWQSPETVDASGAVGGHCDLWVEQDSIPRLSYWRTDTGAAWYAGAEPARQWTIGTLSSEGDVGRYVSFTKAPDDRLAGVFYLYDPVESGAIHYVVIESGAAGSVRVLADSTGSSSGSAVYPDVAVGTDGRWHVSFRNEDETALYYVTRDTVVTGVPDDPGPVEAPNAFGLSQNFPNPFNPTTRINYELDGALPVKIEIYDVAGRLVRRLVDGTQGPGRFSVQWDGHNAAGETVASGVYFYRLNAGRHTIVRKMVVLK